MTSLLALLGGGARLIPTDPPPPPILNTTADGALSSTLRPTWTKVYRVGPGQPYATLASAVNAARAGSPYGKGERWPGGAPPVHRGLRPGLDRQVILLEPGNYVISRADFSVDGLTIGGGIDLVGNGDDRDAVTLEAASDVTWALESQYGIYCANLTLVRPPGGTYPWHGTCAPHVTQTTVFDNVVFRLTATIANGLAGWDTPDDALGFFYRCRFEQVPPGPKPIVFHDMSPEAINRIVFLECSADAAMAAPTGRSYWRQDCTTLDGTPLPNVYRPNRDPEEPYSGGVAGLPVPTGGMTEPERDLFRDPAPAGMVLDPATDPITTASGWIANKVYLIPFTLPRPAMIDRAQITVTGPAGAIAVGMYDAQNDRIVDPGGPNWCAIYPDYPYSARPAVTGTMQTVGTDTGGYLLGQRVWLAIRFTDSACVAQASSGIAAATTCYTADPTVSGSTSLSGLTNLAPVAPGTPMPRVQLVTSWPT